jgi:hypothetical protein
MSTTTDERKVDSRPRYSILLRVFCVVCGLAAIAWGATTLPIFRQQVMIESTARRIVRGETFKVDGLVAQTDDAEAAENSWYCRPSGLRSAALIRLRLAEMSSREGTPSLAESRMEEFAGSVRAALACTPSDPFLWLALYWAENNRNGFKTQYIDYLRMSYRLGPNEGWVMLKRNPFALAVFEQLPPDLADMAVAEFAKILNTEGLKYEAVAIFTGAGWRIRDRLLPALKNVAGRHRQAFADALRSAGYSVAVPGTQSREPRPWD